MEYKIELDNRTLSKVAKYNIDIRDITLEELMKVIQTLGIELSVVDVIMLALKGNQNEI